MFNNFEVCRGLSWELWNIRNHQEMREYIQKTKPEMCFNQDFVDRLATLQMEQLVQKKLELLRLKARGVQYSA